MLVTSVGDSFIEVEVDELRELVAICNIFGLEIAGVCKVSVQIVREGLDTHELQRKLLAERREASNADDPTSKYYEPNLFEERS